MSQSHKFVMYQIMIRTHTAQKKPFSFILYIFLVPSEHNEGLSRWKIGQIPTRSWLVQGGRGRWRQSQLSHRNTSSRPSCLLQYTQLWHTHTHIGGFQHVPPMSSLSLGRTHTYMNAHADTHKHTQTHTIWYYPLSQGEPMMHLQAVETLLEFCSCLRTHPGFSHNMFALLHDARQPQQLLGSYGALLASSICLIFEWALLWKGLLWPYSLKHVKK